MAAPVILTAAYAVRFRLGMPYWDGWELVPDLQKLAAGTLTLGDVWRAHNEHRIVLPRLVMLGLAQVTAWNDAAEVAVSLGAAGATAALLLGQWRRTTARLGLGGGGGLAPLLTLLVFALTQWENWVWGWQLIFFLETLLTTGCLLGLANWDGRGTGRRLALAAALGAGASLTQSLGLLVWPVGAGVLALAGLARRARAEQVARAVGAWLAAGGLVGVLYFSGEAGTQGLAGLGTAARAQPLAYAHYVLNYLGSPVLTYDFAFVAGALGLAAWLGCAGWLAARCGREAWGALLPWAGLGLFALSGALLVGLSRVGLGTHQAIASRYVTLSYPFWASLAVMGYVAGAKAGTGGGGRLARAGTRAALGGMALMVAACSVVGGLLGYYWRYAAVQPARRAALSGEVVSDEALRAVYPDPAVARSRLEYLQEAGLSLFR
jgi:hypothetical protein